MLVIVIIQDGGYMIQQTARLVLSSLEKER